MKKNIEQGNPGFSEVKLSIVMTYFERPGQLLNTLKSFVHHQYGPDVEIIIVDDGSVVSPAAKLESPCCLNITHIYMDPKKKWYSNPSVPFNVGIRVARGETIILQNAECFHLDNIAEHATSALGQTDYFSYACISLSREDTAVALEESNFVSIAKRINRPDRGAVGNGDSGWYNHSIYNPRALHFCSAISSKNLRKLRGFDEHYAKGSCFDDDDFLYRVKALGLQVRIIDDRSVVHQWHYSGDLVDPNQAEKYERNKIIFERITMKKAPYFMLFFYFYLPRAISQLKKMAKKILFSSSSIRNQDRNS